MSNAGLAELHDTVDTVSIFEPRPVDIVLPVTRFDTVVDVERIADTIELASIGSGGRTHGEMFGIFYELGLNAVEHARSHVGCYVVLESRTLAGGGIVHTLGVADCGIGIPAALRMNTDLRDSEDDRTVALSTLLHITGTGQAYRGVGLDHVAQTVKSLLGDCTIISAGGCLEVANGLQFTRRNLYTSDRLDGTAITVTLSGPAVR